VTAPELVSSCLAAVGPHLERVEVARRRVDEAGWNRRTAKDEWSPGEVVEHLIRSHQPYVERVGPALGKAGADPGKPLKHSFVGGFLIRVAGPNGNANAPGPTRPAARSYDESDYQRWVDQMAAWKTVVEAAQGKDLSVRIKNPIVGFLSMNLGDCLELVRDHTERHVRQIEARTASS